MPTDLQAQAKVEAVYQFPSVPIREFQNGKIAGSVTNDRKVLFGSVGSDLWRSASDASGEFRPRSQWSDSRRWPEPPHVLGARI